MPVLEPRTTSDDVYELLNADLGADPRGPFWIHTRRASLQLDAHGICRDVFTLDGREPTEIERCIGAQYIASWDDKGVSAKPNVGGHALLVDRSAGMRPNVIKTAAITGVVYRDDIVQA